MNLNKNELKILDSLRQETHVLFQMQKTDNNWPDNWLWSNTVEPCAANNKPIDNAVISNLYTNDLIRIDINGKAKDAVITPRGIAVSLEHVMLAPTKRQQQIIDALKAGTHNLQAFYSDSAPSSSGRCKEIITWHLMPKENNGSADEGEKISTATIVALAEKGLIRVEHGAWYTTAYLTPHCWFPGELDELREKFAHALPPIEEFLSDGTKPVTGFLQFISEERRNDFMGSNIAQKLGDKLYVSTTQAVATYTVKSLEDLQKLAETVPLYDGHFLPSQQFAPAGEM